MRVRILFLTRTPPGHHRPAGPCLTSSSAPVAQSAHGDVGEEGVVVGAAVEAGRRGGRRINTVSQGGRRRVAVVRDKDGRCEGK
jgi:hypothetical protein